MRVKIITFEDKINIPNRAHFDDAGADIYMLNDGTIEPNETLVIHTGFGLDLPNGTMAYMQVRTSMAKKGLMIAQCAIDAGYKGQIHLIIHNLSKDIISWKAGDRLANLIVLNVLLPEFVQDLGQTREDGAFGSTGR